MTSRSQRAPSASRTIARWPALTAANSRTPSRVRLPTANRPGHESPGNLHRESPAKGASSTWTIRTQPSGTRNSRRQAARPSNASRRTTTSSCSTVKRAIWVVRAWLPPWPNLPWPVPHQASAQVWTGPADPSRHGPFVDRGPARRPAAAGPVMPATAARRYGTDRGTPLRGSGPGWLVEWLCQPGALGPGPTTRVAVLGADRANMVSSLRGRGCGQGRPRTVQPPPEGAPGGRCRRHRGSGLTDRDDRLGPSRAHVGSGSPRTAPAA
jgi:hypothetical protein